MERTCSELADPAATRFGVTVVGGNAVFLVDRRCGHCLYIGLDRRLAPPELRRYVAEVSNDLRTMPIGAFSRKYGVIV